MADHARAPCLSMPVMSRGTVGRVPTPSSVRLLEMQVAAHLRTPMRGHSEVAARSPSIRRPPPSLTSGERATRRRDQLLPASTASP